MENRSNALGSTHLNANNMQWGMLRLLIVGYCVACTVSECPIQLEPSTVVVRYGDPVSVNCTVSEDHEGIGWEASEGSVSMAEGVQFIPWSLTTLTDWEIGPRCYGNFMNNGEHLQCAEKLNITVYKPPDSVIISIMDYDAPMQEGQEYSLKCEVQNVAPVHYLTVKWYKGEVEFESQAFSDDVTKTPMNVSSTILITPTSADDRGQYSCVAELELGPEGPQPPPEVKSEPLYTSVLYRPFFDSPEETWEVTEGEEVPLNCFARGNPPPVYSWSYSSAGVEKTSQTLVTYASLSPGTHEYTCTASNQLGPQSKKFTVKILSKSDQTVLWTVIGVGVALAVLLILGYLYYMSRETGNSII